MATTELLATLITTLAYLAVVRLVDFNEKEPLWAVLMLFALGGAGASLLLVVVPTSLLELELLAGIGAKELVRFGAVGAGFGVLHYVGQRRGFSEINGVMDGVVYGAAGGLGFATGLSLARAVFLPAATTALAGQNVFSYGQVALTGLADGVFGAIIGIGLALMLEVRSQVVRALAPVGAYVAAVVAHAVYLFIGRADPFGAGAAVRKWVALLLPVVVVIAVVVFALGRERSAIDSELDEERETGAVSDHDLATLRSFWTREKSYWAALMRGSFGTWRALHGLHNRQVQLALTKHKAKATDDDDRRADLGEEIAELRRAILDIKKRLEEVG